MVGVQEEETWKALRKVMIKLKGYYFNVIICKSSITSYQKGVGVFVQIL